METDATFSVLLARNAGDFSTFGARLMENTRDIAEEDLVPRGMVEKPPAS